MASPRYCAWGGCDMEVVSGARYCITHGAIVASRLTPTTSPDLFTAPADPTPAERARHSKARATLPESIAEPIAGKAPTSKRAAEAARAGYKSRKALIHAHIIGEGAVGATRPEIAAALAIGVNSVNSACNTLYRQGYIGSNPDHTRPDPSTGVDCAVLVDEAHVTRWQGRPRAERAQWAGGECDLVHPVNGNSMTETEQARLPRELPYEAEEGDA